MRQKTLVALILLASILTVNATVCSDYAKKDLIQTGVVQFTSNSGSRRKDCQ
jgi:hypothetical protein